MSVAVRLQEEDFDPGAELAALAAPGVGAVASFLGLVRDDPDRPLLAMTLEHYPGMAEAELAALAEEVRARFRLTSVRIVHRVGRLLPGARIVLAAVAAPHRADALTGCACLMDLLKVRAPVWKHEALVEGGGGWVEARAADLAAAAAWRLD